MKKLLLYCVFAILLLFSFGCNKESHDDLNSAQGTTIASISHQIEEIKGSLPKLRSTLKSVKSLVATIDEGSEASTKGSQNDDKIKGIKEYLKMLEERIAALEEYVYSDEEITGDWLEMTFATLEMYEETVSILALLQNELETLKEKVEGIDEKLCQEIETSIEASVASMKDWINECLTGYYDIAEIDAKFAAMEESLSAGEEELRKEIENIRKEISQSLNDIEQGYRDAIEEAIKKNNGLIDKKIAKAVEDINSRIDKEISEINKRLDDIEERLSKLEDTVNNLVNRIQSVTYMPLYSDNMARVNFPNEGTSGSTVKLDFIISPSNTVEELAKAYKEIIKVKALYTGSTNFIDLPITQCFCDTPNGILTVTAACDALSLDFYNGDIEARVMLQISDGNNNRTSEQIALTQKYSVALNNQIWYNVNGKLPIDIQVPDGTPRLISNVYDATQACYIATFESDIESIPAEYFGGNDEVISITLPNSVTHINDNAFASCSQLKSIKTGSSLRHIGKFAFYLCDQLEEVDLGESLLTIEEGAFLECHKLKEIDLGESLLTIGDSAFALCSKLQEIDLGESLLTIGDGAFSGCILTSITIPSTLQSVGGYSFSECQTLKEFKGDLAKDEGRCLVINNVLEATAVASINGDYKIPEEVLTIGNTAFARCSRLERIYIHDKIKRIEIYAFSLCDNLKNVEITDLTAWCSIDFIGSNPLSLSQQPYLNLNGETLRDVICPTDLTVIKPWSFYGYDHINSFRCHENVEAIEEGAFNKTLNLKRMIFESSTPPKLYADALPSTSPEVSIAIPQGYETLMTYANSDWPQEYKDLIDIDDYSIIPSNVKMEYSQASSSGAREVYIGNNAANILLHLFDGQDGVIVYKNAPTTFDDIIDARSVGSIKSCILPSEITAISDYALSSWSKLEELTIPETVTNIGDCAFLNCYKLKSITIPEQVTSIGNNAFDRCTKLDSIILKPTLPPTIKSLGSLGSNTKIFIPNNFNSICAYLSDSDWAEYQDLLEYDVNEWGDIENLTLCIEYTTNDDLPIKPVHKPDSFTFLENTYENGKGRILIPKEYTSIDERTFHKCKNLTSITIPEGINSIKDNAFKECVNLETINLPESLTSIGSWAFAKCTNLTSITIPEGVPSIGEYAFDGCTKLDLSNLDHLMMQITYTTNNNNGIRVSSIDNFNLLAYNFENGIGQIIISKDCTYIKEDAFMATQNLTSITIPEGINSIENSAFINCPNLESINLPESLTNIGRSAFFSCTNLASITIPEGVSSIGQSAFRNCRNLTSITIPEGVSSIGQSVFYECTNLDSIILKPLTPPSIKGLGVESNTKIFIPNNFNSICAYLSDSNWAEHRDLFEYDLSKIEDIDNLTLNIEYTTNDGLPIVIFEYEEIFIVLDNTCENGKGRIVIPKEKTYIPMYTFCNENLTSISIPEGINSIEDAAFSGCINLETINLPESLTNIGSYVFYRCTNLTSITIPEGVSSIGSGTFWECTNLDSIILKPLTPPSIEDLGLGSNTKIFVPIESMYDYLNSNWVEYKNFFEYGVDIDKLTLCIEYTTNNNLPIKQVDQQVSYTIIKHIYENRQGCILISKEHTTISSSLFRYCETLTGITIPEGINSIDDMAFSGCSSLRKINLPDSLTHIGDKAFWGCSYLQEINLPESLTNIGKYAFYNCTYLRSITIPEGVVSIGRDAFVNCTKLDSIILKPLTPPAIDYSLGITGNTKIYIPTESKDDYLNSSWTGYQNVFEYY